MKGPERTKRKAAESSGRGAEYLMLAPGYFPGYGVAAKDVKLFFDGVPGKHMKPLNEAAVRAYNAMAEAKGLPKHEQLEVADKSPPAATSQAKPKPV